MLNGNLGGSKGCVKAVRRRMCGHNDHRALSVPAVQGLVKVGLLGLGRKSGGRTSALHVNYNQRQLCHNRKTQRLRLERKSRTRSGRYCKVTRKRGAYGSAYARNLVFRLQGLASQTLM